MLLWIFLNLYHKHTFFLPQVRVLFSKGPFIAIFASDPHIIIKAINQNLNSVLRDSNINGHDYMRNIVHLPVFLNSRGLSNARKFLVTSTTNGDIPCTDTTGKDPVLSCFRFEVVCVFYGGFPFTLKNTIGVSLKYRVQRKKIIYIGILIQMVLSLQIL